MSRILLLLFTVGCSLFTVTAQSLTDTQIRQQINQAASALKTMQCDFVQTKQLKLLNDKLVSQGKMYYQQPNRLRWEYQQPYTYTFILNDQKVLLKNQRRNDVIDVRQNRIFGEIARIMMNSVIGKSLSDERDFRVALTQSSTEFVATLIPQRKDLRQLFSQIVLHFSRSQKMVSRVELVEKNGDRTLIELKNLKTNGQIPATLFAVD